MLSVKEAQGMKIPPPGPKEYWEDSEWAYEHMNEISDWCVTIGSKLPSSKYLTDLPCDSFFVPCYYQYQ